MLHRREYLPDALRQRLERGFAVDLSAVRVHRCRTARRLTEKLGTVACAVDGAIFLGADVPDMVLAHEVVHLLQARLPGAGRVAAAEAEAHHLAARALAGLPCRVAVPADAAQPLRWEEAGHYYTVYYVALACGLPNDDAMRIAFWTQFPDEVSELDAVKAGFDMPRAARDQVGAWLYEDTGIRESIEQFVVGLNNDIVNAMGLPGGHMTYVKAEPYKDLQVNLDVQRGLHCLTGANWDDETSRRAWASGKADLSDGYFEFGMSLHCFGDSYAHRNHDSGKMYPTVIGHGIETKFTQIAGDEVSKLINAQHTDALTPARLREFKGYVLHLYSIIASRFPQFPRRSDPEMVAFTLTGVLTEQPDPNEQIGRIRASASAQLKIPMDDYRPEKAEDLPLLYFTNHPRPIVATWHHVNRGLQLARLWNPA